MRSEKISVVLLSGGKGKRMGGDVPKQYVPLKNKPVVLHSLEIFLAHPEVWEVIVVADPAYHPLFAGHAIKFALPGETRQESLYNGMRQAMSPWVCVHDAARPFISLPLLSRLFSTGKSVGAAATGLPMKATVKEVQPDQYVRKTLNRNHLWEIQTPQLVAKRLLEQGFSLLKEQGGEVTDDVSLAELAGHPVKLIMGDEKNFKITTREDFQYAQWLATN